MSSDLNREAYREKIEAELQELDARIDLLKAKKNQMSADAKQEYAAFMEDLQQNQKEARDALQELKEAGAESWQDMRQRIDETVNNLSMAVSKAAERFKVTSPTDKQ